MKHTYELREWVRWIIFFSALYLLLQWVGFALPSIPLPWVGD